MHVRVVSFLFVIVSCVGSSESNSSCFSVKLYDRFGDGWGDVYFLIETPIDEIKLIKPNCSINLISFQVCGEKGGTYSVRTMNYWKNEVPKNYWEVSDAHF